MNRIIQFFMMLIILITTNALSVNAIGLEEISINGFLTQEYSKSNHNNMLTRDLSENGETTSELGLTFSVFPSDELRIGLQILARELGDVGNYKAQIDWALADYKSNDLLGLRIGKIKRPAGFHNQYRDVDLARTWIMLPQSVYYDQIRDPFISILGAELYGNIYISGFGDIEYELLTGTIEASDQLYLSDFVNYYSGVILQVYGYGGMHQLSNIDFRSPYSLGGALRWNTPIEGLRLGFTHSKQMLNFDATVSYFGTTPFTITDKKQIFDMSGNVGFNKANIASAEYSVGLVKLSGEYMWLQMDMKGDIKILDPILGTDAILESNQEGESYYLAAEYQIHPDIETGTYYSVYYDDINDKKGKKIAAIGGNDFAAWSKDWCLTTRLNFSENWSVKLEKHWINGTAYANLFMNPDGVKKNWQISSIRSTFNF